MATKKKKPAVDAAGTHKGNEANTIACSGVLVKLSEQNQVLAALHRERIELLVQSRVSTHANGIAEELLRIMAAFSINSEELVAVLKAVGDMANFVPPESMVQRIYSQALSEALHHPIIIPNPFKK